ncbi:nucleolar DEAD-box protein required for synthesis of 60S ribosomal subunit [Ascosphaera acerosa]|nr:nucleolar DEAD-box protein required for synthesis of 60S ribosomal subunit [Ascosphaera acerosa]
MAPIDDDFVLTLSDDDAPVVEDDELDTDADNAFGTARKDKSNKRKREAGDSATPAAGQAKKSKKLSKKERRRHPDTGAAATADTDADSDSEERTARGADDGALDPDFEFDVGGAAQHGTVEEFDGWGGAGNAAEVTGAGAGAGAGGAKKGVDLDAIIARRAEKKRENAAKQDSQGDDGSDDDDGFVGFDDKDDELLAEDGFGMGADAEQGSDEEEEEGKEEGEEGGAGADVDGSSDDDGSDGNDSDSDSDDSVAAPVPHPDDLRSDSSDSEGEDAEDAEEAAKAKAFYASEDQTPAKSDSTFDSFQSFSLSRPIIRGLTSIGFTAPTPIQQKAIPVALLGKDIVGGAVTGSGKTAAFLVPILERLLYRPKKVATSRVAILMPTRELAIQCYNVGVKLATYTDITFCQMVGGFSLREQENILKKRPDVIIATPGRFIDHMRNSASFTVDTLEILVLDEADRMLEDGFADELNEILTTIPKTRQTMLFSATMTSSIDKLISVGLNKPVRLMVDAKKQTVTTLTQEFVRLRPGREDKRLAVLVSLCENVYKTRVIIFFRQKKEAHRVRIIFGLFGLKSAELHGSMSQEQRIKAVEDFRDGRVSFLLATDVASRGLDIKGVETVINYEAPQSHEIYLHRVGRTARAGRSGRACTIAAEPDRKVVKAAVKTGKSQGAKIVSRVMDAAEVDRLAAKIDGLADEVEEILKEEKEEKQLAQAEMEVTRGENLLKHEKEIMARPKRTWFATEKEKADAKLRAKAELNGMESLGKQEKRRLSNKEKKKLDASREMKEGRVWKKGKTVREDPAVNRPSRGAAGKGKGKGKGKGGKPTGSGASKKPGNAGKAQGKGAGKKGRR